MVLTSSKTVVMLLGGLVGMVRLRVRVRVMPKKVLSKTEVRGCVCFCTRAALLNSPPNKKISIGYFCRPKYINPKMTEKSARVLSDEGRAN